MKAIAIFAALYAIGLSAPAQTIRSITSAASGQPGPVAPGEIVVLNGSLLGPSQLVSAPIPGTGALPTTLGGVRVTFNGIVAPMIFVSGTQTSVQVPYEVAGMTSASVALLNGFQAAPAFTVPIASAAPGLFTLDSSGNGQVTALNTGGQNSPTNPAPKGAAVLLYTTGEGVTTPAGVDGTIETNTVICLPIQPVSVQIAGSPAQVLFTGRVPGDDSGVIEIGILVPTNVSATGSVPITLSAGGVTTTQQTIIVIQ